MLHPRYSVVIPVYCSAPLLPTLVERLDAFFAHYPWSHEVIFVNDGSPDESWEVLERLKAERDDIVIIDLLPQLWTAQRCVLRAAARPR